jgi:SGNH domain (fused to AT3 domains)
MRSTPRIAAVSLAVLLALAGCSKLGANAGAAPAAAGSDMSQVAQIQQISTQEAQTPAATAAQVLAAVKAAADVTTVPDNLAVPVSKATDDGPEAGWDGCLVDDDASTVKDGCVYGDKQGTKTVVLYGDSHAGMWESAFDVAGKRTHTKVLLFAKPACAVPALSFWDETTQRKNTECDAWHAWATDKIVSLKPNMVVLTSLFTGPRDFDKKDITEAQWSTGLTATLNKVKTSGAKMVVLGDMPYLAQSAPECLAAHAGDVTACATKASVAVNYDHDADEKKTAKAAGAQYVNTVDWFCSDMCSPIVNNMIVYQNQWHLTAAYSRYLSGILATSLSLG